MALKIRQLKYGTNAIVLCVGALVFLVLCYGILERHPWRWDSTANKEQSLSDQSKRILKELSQDVTITAFFRRGEDVDDVYIRRKVDDLLKEYSLRSPKIRYHMVNPDLEVEETVKYGITTDGTVVFTSGNLPSGKNRKDIYKSQLFDFAQTAEQQMPAFLGEGVFTNALFTVTQAKQKTISFLEGHGERPLDGVEPTSLSEIKKYLEKNNYQVKTFSFVTTPEVPEDTDLLVIAGPSKALPSAEEKKVSEYLSKGRLLLLVEPSAPATLESLLREMNLRLERDVVLDPERHFLLGPHYPAPVLGDHPITKELQSMNPILAIARSLAINGQQEGVTAFLTTSPAAWGETNLASEGEAKFNEGQDIKGPLTVGVAVQKEEKPSAVVVGDVDFASNSLIEVPGNLDLFLNMVSWLTGEGAKLSIGPKKTDFRSITPTPGQARFIAYFSQLGYPLLILAGGLIYWYRRKNK